MVLNVNWSSGLIVLFCCNCYSVLEFSVAASQRVARAVMGGSGVFGCSAGVRPGNDGGLLTLTEARIRGSWRLRCKCVDPAGAGCI